VILQGKTTGCYKDVADKLSETGDIKKLSGKWSGWLFSFTDNHWATEVTNKEYFDEVIVPHADSMRMALFQKELEKMVEDGKITDTETDLRDAARELCPFVVNLDCWPKQVVQP
jgi:hypothetical protein